MKLRTSVVTAIAAGMCLSLTSTRATSSSPRADSSEAPRADEVSSTPRQIVADVPPQPTAAVATDIESTVTVVPEPEVDVAVPAVPAQAPPAPVAPHAGPYTLAETVSWMHVNPELPPSAWEGETALDRPEVFARAMKMYTRPIGDSTTSAALSTAGYGTEASADGVYVRVATLGHGDGEIAGAALGPRAVGVAADGTEHAHRAASISLRDVDVNVGHGISRAAVQGVVRQNFGQLSTCYPPSLTETASLRGRVVVRFVIGQDGSVEVAQDAGSDPPNATVVNCVVRRFLLLTFPRPDDGKVTVTYPLVFAPEDAPH